MKPLRLQVPVMGGDNPVLSQIFGQSRATYKLDFPDMVYGHNGIDYISNNDKRCGYGTKILASHDFTSVTIESDFPNKKRGNGIYLRGKLPIPFLVNGIMADSVETCYWHLSDFEINGTTKGKAGDVIGLMGNAGYVWPPPTANYPWNGTHLHFGVRFYHSSGNIISSQFSGNYVDPLPFLYSRGSKIGPAAYLGNNLVLGSYGDDVSRLQSMLSLEEVFTGEPTGQFGPQTFASVVAYQKKHLLTPVGAVGPQTRGLLNLTYA